MSLLRSEPRFVWLLSKPRFERRVRQATYMRAPASPSRQGSLRNRWLEPRMRMVPFPARLRLSPRWSPYRAHRLWIKAQKQRITDQLRLLSIVSYLHQMCGITLMWLVLLRPQERSYVKEERNINFLWGSRQRQLVRCGYANKQSRPGEDSNNPNMRPSTASKEPRRYGLTQNLFLE